MKTRGLVAQLACDVSPIERNAAGAQGLLV
jgi:hypothetical protein